MRITRRSALTGGLAASSLATGGALARGRHVGVAANSSSPVPTAINFSPTSPTSIYDTATPGTVVNTISVSMSDFSGFTGTLGFAAPNFDASGLVAFSGSTLVLTTSASDGDHFITVSATENSTTITNNLTLTVLSPSTPVNFTTGINNMGSPSGPTGHFQGMQINLGTTGPTPPGPGPAYPLIVSALGRWVLSGNSGTHVMKIVDAVTKADVPGSSVTINTAGMPANAFTYATLSSPVTLGANQSYYIVSMESGDQFGDGGTTIFHTGVAFIPNAISFDGTNWSSSGPYEACYGPLDFVYTLGTAVNVGTPMTPPNRTSYIDAYIVGDQGVSGVLTGTTINFDCDFAGFAPPPVNSMIVEYIVSSPDGSITRSPYILGPTTPGRLRPNFPWTFDSTTLVNGTHHFLARFVDSNPSLGAGAAYGYRAYAGVYLVQNPAGSSVADYSAAQVVPTGMVTTGQPFGATSTLPDFVSYPGTPQQMNTYNRVPFSVAPTNDVKYRNYGNLYIEDMSGVKEQEFSDNPIFATTHNQGGVFIDYTSVDTAGGSAELMYPFAFASATRPGGRTNAFTTPLTTWVAAEGSDPTYGDDTGYLGIELRGSLVHLAWNGEETFLAGITWDPSKLAFRNYQAQGHETEIVGQCQTLGTIVSPTFSDFAAMGGLNDLCIDPRDATGNTVYVVNIIDSYIIKVDRNFSPPHLSRYAGQEGVTGYVNGNAVTTALFSACSSIIMCDGSVSGFPIGTMLVADRDNSAIRRIDPSGTTVDTLCGNQTSKPSTADLSNPSLSDTWSPSGSVSFTAGNDSTGAYINYPFTIRFASDKSKIIWTELYTSTFRVVDLTAHTVTRIPNTKGVMVVGYSGWSWFDPDTMGVLGPVDDCALAVGNGGINNWVYVRVSLDGSFVDQWVGDGVGRVGEGPGDQAGTAFAPLPVYSWVSCFAKTRSHYIGGGFRYWGIYGARPRQPSDPPIDINARIGLNIDVFDKASAQEAGLWWNGTSMCFPLGVRPSFACLYGELCNGLLGSSIVPNCGDLAATYPTDGSFTAEVCATGTLGRYLQLGGAGSVPRPELTGNDLQVLCYYIRRVALSGTYPTTATPGTMNPDNVIPLITGVSAVQISNGTDGHRRIQVTWTTDKRTIGMAIAGSPAQQSTSLKYNIWSPMEGAFGTSHTSIIAGLPPTITTVHYCVISKDVAGNSAYSSDLTVPIT